MNPEIEGILILWKRELIIFSRSKSRVIGSLGMPFFLLAILGTGLNNAFMGEQGGYLQYIAPGIVGMVLMFSSMFSGIIVLMDRKFGFLKETLVAPISRLSIVLGKAIGGATTAMVQGTIMLAIAIALGVQVHTLDIPLLFLLMFLISIMFVSLGIAFASVMEDMHGFQLVMNFLIMPLFFLSGALFPLNDAPEILQIASKLDPLTYGVAGLRFLLTGNSDINFLFAFTALLVYTGIFITVAITLFNRIEE